jgi:hypothetical protein
LRRALDEFSDERARDVVLLNRPEGSGNEASQPGGIGRRMGIARDDPRAEDRQVVEADRSNGLFFEPHHARIPNPAVRVTASG